MAQLLDIFPALPIAIQVGIFFTSISQDIVDIYEKFMQDPSMIVLNGTAPTPIRFKKSKSEPVPFTMPKLVAEPVSNFNLTMPRGLRWEIGKNEELPLPLPRGSSKTELALPKGISWEAGLTQIHVPNDDDADGYLRYDI